MLPMCRREEPGLESELTEAGGVDLERHAIAVLARAPCLPDANGTLPPLYGTPALSFSGRVTYPPHPPSHYDAGPAASSTAVEG